jgi:hypothetical protein
MILADVFQQFVKESPVCVMVRATLENVLSPERVDNLFARTAVRQRESELLFSTVADLMGLVVCRIRPSVHAAYQARAEAFQVSLAALYDKLRGIEPHVSRTLVRETAERMGAIVRHTGGALPELLPGYRVLIADGNHLPATERRLKELRTRNVAPLPGHAVVVFDPALMLAVDVLPCADGHASERTLLPALLERLEAKDLLIADRNFCTTQFLIDIDRRDAFFLIRQHGSSLKYELIGRRRKIGRIATGLVYEQDLRLLGAHDATLTIRRITIQLVSFPIIPSVMLRRHCIRNPSRGATRSRVVKPFRHVPFDRSRRNSDQGAEHGPVTAERVSCNSRRAARVAMVQSADLRDRDHLAAIGRLDLAGHGCIAVQRQMTA